MHRTVKKSTTNNNPQTSHKRTFTLSPMTLASLAFAESIPASNLVLLTRADARSARSASSSFALKEEQKFTFVISNLYRSHKIRNRTQFQKK